MIIAVLPVIEVGGGCGIQYAQCVLGGCDISLYLVRLLSGKDDR